MSRAQTPPRTTLLSRAAIACLAISILCGCNDDRANSDDAARSRNASESAPPQERATYSPESSVGADGVSADARERDLEIGNAQRTNYLALQASLRSALAQTDPALAEMLTFEAGTVSAVDAPGLLQALANAREGTVVFVPSTARIDLTGHERIVIPAGVTLASDRHTRGSSGALLYTSDPGATLFAAQERARIVGLDLMGPDPSSRSYQLERLMMEGGHDLYYAVPASIGIYTESSNVRIENCELWGWSNAAVAVGPGAHEVQVRHCFLHHNQRLRLGYGVYLDQADALLEANLFDWYRHCVAGSGRPGTSYEARYNYVLPNASGHAFDMHGGADRNDGTDIAGDHIKIHRNIVEAAQFPAVVVRGRPRVGLEISENQFRNPDPARTLVLQAGEESATVVGNKFGVSSMRAK